MTDNLPNDDDMVTAINVITQDYVEDDSVVAKVVDKSTENISGVTTRACTNRVFSLSIAHGANFDVTGNDDSVKDSSTDDDNFVQVITKKRKVDKSTISAADKKALNCKLDSLVKKNEKSRTANKTTDLSLEKDNKKVRRLETDARLLNKKFCRAEAENSDRKSEETRLIVINKSLKKAVDKHQKEAHRLLFFDEQTKRQCVVHREEYQDRF